MASQAVVRLSKLDCVLIQNPKENDSMPCEVLTDSCHSIGSRMYLLLLFEVSKMFYLLPGPFLRLVRQFTAVHSGKFSRAQVFPAMSRLVLLHLLHYWKCQLLFQPNTGKTSCTSFIINVYAHQRGKHETVRVLMETI